MANRTIATFDQVNQEIQPDNEDHIFWWNTLGQSFTTLLSANHYDTKHQLQYLRWFYRAIMPSLGPRPVDGKPHYASSFTYDGSPLEYSLNWKEKKIDPTIRFTTEPCSSKAGTDADPFNQLTAMDVLKGMANYIPSLDLTRFYILLSATNVPVEATDKILSKLPPGYPRARVLVAYDLEDGNIIAKAYFNPGHRAFLQGTSTKNVGFDAIRKCNGPAGSYDASIEAIDGHLRAFNTDETPQVTLLSNDCVKDTPSSRLKVYVMARVHTLGMVKNMFHLGGRLTGRAIAEGLNSIEEFWRHVFDTDRSTTDIHDKQVLSKGSSCIFVYEMRPTPIDAQKSEIEVKWHMPASWLGTSDAQVCEVMAAWFRKRNHPELAERYLSDLTRAFPRHDLSIPGRLTHTWISLTYTKKTGIYMTMYYTPRLPEFYYPST
ncbi:aromatic prenyltransferase [Xylaria scruposa]|nr:aromatic prenyltransferase [Xylaria scruposa]